MHSHQSLHSWYKDVQPAAVLRQGLGLPKPLPAVALGSWPTPVEPLTHLTEALGAEVWIKRDELSATLYGGNKIRKLELLFGEAQTRGSRSVVTIGGIGSHQVLATAIYGRQLGLHTHAVVFPQPVTADVRRNIHLASALGVALTPFAGPDQLQEALGRACEVAPDPWYLIPIGGSSPIGNLGYVAAAMELHEQITTGQLPPPDAMFLPVGSGGMMAGLALGSGLVGLEVPLIGVRVAHEESVNAAMIRRQIAAMTGLLRRLGAQRLPAAEPAFTILDDQFGEQYGQPTPAAVQAVKLAQETEGLVLETTYTGKTMAALMAYCQDIGKGQRVLFWNTNNARDTASLLLDTGERPLPDAIEQWLVQDAVDLS